MKNIYFFFLCLSFILSCIFSFFWIMIGVLYNNVCLLLGIKYFYKNRRKEINWLMWKYYIGLDMWNYFVDNGYMILPLNALNTKILSFVTFFLDIKQGIPLININEGKFMFFLYIYFCVFVLYVFLQTFVLRVLEIKINAIKLKRKVEYYEKLKKEEEKVNEKEKKNLLYNKIFTLFLISEEDIEERKNLLKLKKDLDIDIVGLVKYLDGLFKRKL